MKLILLMITLISFINGNFFFLLIFFFYYRIKITSYTIQDICKTCICRRHKSKFEDSMGDLFYFMSCSYFGFQSLPSSVKVLTLYAQFLSKSFVSVQPIKNYISGVKTLHVYTENEFPQKDTFQLNLILKELSRLNPHCPHCPKQASPITPNILLECDRSLRRDFLVFIFTRIFLNEQKSNLVPNSVKTFNPNKQLCRSNIEINSEKNILLINISWSKTIQFGERNLVVPLISIPDSPLCPVKAYHNMISLVRTSKNSPAFYLFKLLPVTYFQFQKVLKSLIKSIGKDPDEYSSHSFLSQSS